MASIQWMAWMLSMAVPMGHTPPITGHLPLASGALLWYSDSLTQWDSCVMQQRGNILKFGRAVYTFVWPILREHYPCRKMYAACGLCLSFITNIIISIIYQTFCALSCETLFYHYEWVGSIIYTAAIVLHCLTVMAGRKRDRDPAFLYWDVMS